MVFFIDTFSVTSLPIELKSYTNISCVLNQHVADVAWGKHTRVVLDIGCGVASFGASLFDRDVITMSFAPKDEHEAQVQLALERGIPAISAVMGTQRLPFPSNAFDLAHCARCRIHWHGDGKYKINLGQTTPKTCLLTC